MEPEEIETLRQLADALVQLRSDRNLSLRGMPDAAEKLKTPDGRRWALPRSTASDLQNAKSVPQRETVETWLAVCGVQGEEAQRPWLQALGRVANSHHQRPAGAIRVRDARARVLGVHAAIQVDQPTEDNPATCDHQELPLYVPRDIDADLRTKISLAGQQGGFVLVTGDSSTGKTRSLFEAVQTVLPDWWLLHPAETTALREFAQEPARRTVVWLDELQDYLDSGGGVPAGKVRSMIEAGVVLVATCWPSERTNRIALPTAGQPHHYANDRRLLGLADVITVPDALSTHERRRAEELASADHRIRVALDTPDAGFTQVMAAGPELIRHWEHAPPHAKAVITAALDARRVGARAPLTRDHLEAAAPGYLTTRQRATLQPHWLDDALNYATYLLHGATSTLCPIAAGVGTVAGYQVADYLHQHALRVRRTEHLSDTAWKALTSHHHPDDTQRLTVSASRRGRNCEALFLAQKLVDRGVESAATWSANLLGKLGKQEQLRQLADNGNLTAASWLAALLVKQGNIEQLHERAANGDKSAASRLAGMLAKNGEVEKLRERAADGDEFAARWLAHLLDGREEMDQLRKQAAYGNEPAATRLADLLADWGKIDELKERANNGDEAAASRLVILLVDQEKIEELRGCVAKGNRPAAVWLPVVLARRGEVKEIMELAAKGDKFAAMHLRYMAEKRQEVEYMLESVTQQDGLALLNGAVMVDLLVELGMNEQLEQEVAAGTIGAADALRQVQSR
ncbi:hypothetical protein AB0E55_19115 [Amycolatopsis keratiniphila]|uniref:hypothetical protein n=1 Tax=Amycolatopsis keratiniphila TaxID=129921 RepID=UPI0034064173